MITTRCLAVIPRLCQVRRHPYPLHGRLGCVNIVLIGMRGVGKTNIARRVSFLTKRPDMSTDILVEYEAAWAFRASSWSSTAGPPSGKPSTTSSS